MDFHKRYADVLEAMRVAEIQASESGLSGIELRAHVFLAAMEAGFAAAIAPESKPPPPPLPTTQTPTPAAKPAAAPEVK